MSSPLVIVESPTKAKTIGRFLGGKAQVLASQGHVRDLPAHSLGVDIAKNFNPEYELTGNGKKIVPALKKAAKSADQIFLATDPDREGEAIAWHLQEVLRGATKAPFHRVTFHEITQAAIDHSFQHAGSLNQDMVNAQQARRVLDRIVGYQVSPLLWKSIQKGTSAGRVQTVALRLVVEREREIQAFKPMEYWNLDALFQTVAPEASFRARLSKINGAKVLVSSAEKADLLEHALLSDGVSHTVLSVTNTPRRKNAAPPFITSTLQQAAGSALRFGASQTMKVAQELYEGIDLGKGQVGLITYMRTDSFNISKEAQTMARAYIAKHFGDEYVPETPNNYRARKLAQEAHEAIRPTDLRYDPDQIAGYLTPQQLKLYRLIWNRFLASQMAPAKQVDHVIEVESKGGSLQWLSADGLVEDSTKNASTSVVCIFRAAARETIFPGFMKVYNIREVGEAEDPDEVLNTLPALPSGTACSLEKLLKQQCFTQPPARYSEAALVKALEQNGVGRPSTYATTVNTIQTREYVTKEKGALIPTALGLKTCDFLVEKMPVLFDVGFTAKMEDDLDSVEEGKLDWTAMLDEFYKKFQCWSGCPTVVDNGKIMEMLQVFPQNFVFAPAVKKGRRTYDDSDFIEKMRTQVKEGTKSLTDKQWQAIIMTIARYVPTHPELLEAVDALGYGDAVRAGIETLRQVAERPRLEVSPSSQALLQAMKGIEFNPPQKIRNRTYDDGKFVKSLQSQVESGSGLSEAQVNALLKIAANYAAKIPDYAKLVRDITGVEPVASSASVGAPSPEFAEKIRTLFQLCEKITQWRPAVSKGRFSYDDQRFVSSIQNAFQAKGQLSEKQLAAFLKVMKNYVSQVPELEAAMNGISVQIPNQVEHKAELLEEECPQCHSKLIRRWARGRSFIGCSAFPKCRYIKKDTPSQD